jgi:hypothetical protein
LCDPVRKVSPQTTVRIPGATVWYSGDDRK